MPYRPTQQYRGDFNIRGIGESIAGIGEGIAQMMGDAKREAQAFKGIQEYMDAMGYATKDQSLGMSLPEAIGYMRAMDQKAELESKRQSQEYLRAQVEAMEESRAEKQAERQRLEAFNRAYREGFQSLPAAARAGALTQAPVGAGLDAVRRIAEDSPVVSQPDYEIIAARLAEQGMLTPELWEQLKKAGGGGLDEFRAKTDRMNAEANRIIANERLRPPPEGEAREIKMEDGSPSGWLRFPDGSFRRKPGATDAINPTAFDLDGDGVISLEEAMNASMAEKFGGVYPGMRVGPPAGQPAGQPAPGFDPNDPLRAYLKRSPAEPMTPQWYPSSKR